MSRTEKRYPLADDLCIECVTLVDNDGNKIFEVAVVFTPFELEIESVKGIKSPDEANKCYKKMVAKYK